MLCGSGAEFEESWPEGAACIHSPPSLEGLCSSPVGRVLSPQLTWSYWVVSLPKAGHAEFLTASAHIATALHSLWASTHVHKECVCSTLCLSKLVSICCGPQFPKEVGFSGPYFYHLPSIPGSPVQPFPQFKVSQRSVKRGSIGIQ